MNRHQVSKPVVGLILISAIQFLNCAWAAADDSAELL